MQEGLVTIKNNQTKVEDKIMFEYVIYYLEEHLSVEDTPFDETDDYCCHHEETEGE